MGKRYDVNIDFENDCLSVTDTLGEITNSFGSEQLYLHSIEDAEPIVERLQFLECYVKELENHLGYHGYSDSDFSDIREDVKFNLE